jgi:DNA-binding protein H-NS
MDQSVKTAMEQLLEQQRAIQSKIEELRDNHRQEGLQRAVSLLEEYNLTLDDLGAHLSKRKGRNSGNSGSSEKSVPAKYRDPATGDSWSGRGLKPRWLTAALEKGRTLEEFFVGAPGEQHHKANDAAEHPEPAAQESAASPTNEPAYQ